jgi:hypothetical protein
VGTRVGVHRSQFELERVLGRYGATDFAFVEADARAAIQFAIDGRYVELALPLPDASSAHFTHTASGRPRAIAAQERAYEQALREHWRGLLLAVRGKLQSVESGLSTFDDEFRSFLVPHREEKTKRDRKKPRAVTWLLGSSHSVAIALVAAFLVPASAVGAFALPPTVVGHLAAPFRGALPDELGVPSDNARAVALGQSIWARAESPSAPAHQLNTRPSRSAHRVFAATVPQADEPALGAPASEPATSGLAGLRHGGETPASPPSPPPAPSTPPPSPGAGKPAAPPEAAPAAPVAPDEPTTPSEPTAPTEEATEPANTSESTPAPAEDTPSDESSNAAEPPADEPEEDSGDSSDAPNTDPPPPPPTPAPPADPGKDKDKDNGHDNGNHNGADNGNKNGADNGNGNGNGNGKAKGH